MRISPVIDKLNSRLSKYYDEEEFSISYKSNFSDRYTDINLYIEDRDVDEFFKLIDEFDDVVKRFDQSSYFDVVKPGHYLARIYWDVAEKSDNPNLEKVIDDKNLIKFGNAVCYAAEDECGIEFFLDDIEYSQNNQKLTIALSSDDFDVEVSQKVFEDDIDSYEDLVDMFQDKLVDKILKEVESN